jgi:AcrR family transcriptional regulator
LGVATTSSAGPGRPRDPRIDDAVRVATCELLVEVGYQRLSYELIAQRAGASRPALYRRWPTKAHLVHDAVFPRGVEAMVETDNFEHDLRTMITSSLATYARPEARIAVLGVLADLDDREHRDNVVGRLQQPVRAHLAARVARAVVDGELHPRIDAAVLFDAMIGALIQRVVIEQDPDPAYADQLTSLLLEGLRP